jgi:predicted dehydrogenase
MINVAVIGYGYWGPNLVRNFLSAGCHVKTVVDMNENRLFALKKAYPFIESSMDIDSTLADTQIDAVAIALPVTLHYPIVKKALLAGKHVVVEKPMTKSAATSRELIDIALREKKVLMCDHTFLYTGAVRKISQLIKDEQLGSIEYFDSVRINLGLFQSDINVIWDLAPHDISILNYIMEKSPTSIVATGLSHTGNDMEDIAYLTMLYDDNFIAHASVSWVSPVKIRKVLIGGTKNMVVYDDIEPTEKIKIYDSGYRIKSDEDQKKMRIDYRTGDIFIPKIDTTEALSGMVTDFMQAIDKGRKPVSDAELSLSVVTILEAAEKSIKNHGKEVKL